MNSALLSRTPTLVSLAAIALTVIIVAMNVPPIARALQLSHGDVIEEIDAKFAEFTANHQTEQTLHAERFKGRSLFFRPNLPAPPRDPTPRVEAPVRTPPPVVETPPSEPPPPRTYTGPAIRAFDGDRVWFANGELIRVGEESGGIRVIAVNAPWTVEVAYAGWEGKVELFPAFNPDKVFRNTVDASRADLSGITSGSGAATARTSAPQRSTTGGRQPGRPTATPARGRDADNGAPPE